MVFFYQVSSLSDQDDIPAKCCVYSKVTCLTVVVLCFVFDCSHAFRSLDVVAPFSSSSRKTKLNSITPFKDYGYGDDDEMTGPFFFSGEPKVDESSLDRLENTFQQPPVAAATETTTTEEPIAPYKDYGFGDDDEITGPFFFSGEPVVEESSLNKLENLFQNQAEATATTTDTTMEGRIRHAEHRVKASNDFEEDAWQ